MRTRQEGLEEKILQQADALLLAGGPDAVNIRAIAAGCGVAPGTVYLYFRNKDAILLALAERFWREALGELRTAIAPQPFVQALSAMYQFLRGKMDDFRAGLLGALRQSGQEGAEASLARERTMQQALADGMIPWLQADAGIPAGVWRDGLSQASFVAFVLTYLLAQLERHADNIDTLLEVVQRILYPA